jgi:hypothetical protein
MKPLYLLGGIILSFACLAQNKALVTYYPKTIHVKSDSFLLYYPLQAKPMPINFGNMDIQADTADMGNEATKNAYYDLIYDKASIRISYDNFPHEQITYIPMQMGGRKFIQRLRFNPIVTFYSNDYIKTNTGKANFDIPEVYELANIIWTLSPKGQAADNLNTYSKYYQEVYTYFKPFLTHPVFRKLDKSVTEYFEDYYDFRENSLSFYFEKGKLVRKEPYFYVYGKNEIDFNSLFQRLLPEIESFAKTSRFQDFYKKHQAYYQQSIAQQKQLMPVKQMWQWMEHQFDTKYNAYKIVYSPLIGATHSTSHFFTSLQKGKGVFRESVMFVSGPEMFEQNTNYTPKQKEGLASGIVFTEIDHNYVNPLSGRYIKQIDTIFNKRTLWTAPDGDTDLYPSPFHVFNEYMTHAVFCAYVKDTYDAQTADFVINQRVKLMVERRKYIRFKEFTEELLRIKGSQKIKDTYPTLLAWASKVH